VGEIECKEIEIDVIARSIARILPWWLRAPLGNLYKSLRLLRPLDVEKARPRKRYNGRHVAVVGLFRSATGIGRGAELIARTIEQRGGTVDRVDITALLGVAALSERTDVKLPKDCIEPDTTDVIVVVNPDKSHVLAAFDRRWLLERCIVGHWIWELEQLPRSWRRLACSFDEIWAPTTFVADGIRRLLPEFPNPIEVLPYGVESDPLPAFSNDERRAARMRYAIADDTRVLGYSFSAGSNYERKNPEAAIDVFRNVFADGLPGFLVLRCQDFEDYPSERSRLLSYIAGDPRIRLFEQHNRLGLFDFYRVIDVLVSPARAEGYGLTLAEAAQAGVPVVTSSWRLPPEILHMPLVHAVGFKLVPVKDPHGVYTGIADARWADPDLDEMAAAVRKLCSAGG